MKIFGMGGFELVIILVVILLIFGPKNLPKLGSAIGKTVSNLRSGMNEGKKKKEEDESKSQDENDSGVAENGSGEAVALKPAELEGEVEYVVEDRAQAVEPEDAEAPDAAIPVDTPKKVRRVVKKKTEG